MTLGKINSCEWFIVSLNVKLETSVMRLIFHYLINRKHQTKVGCHYSTWKELLFRVLQGSVLGWELCCLALF